jgi:hypothetical protein
MATPIQRIKDQPGGVWAEDVSNLIPSAFGAPNRGGTMYVQPYMEEVMRRILKDLEDRGYDLKANPNLFRIASSYRTQEEQDILFQAALDEYGTEEIADDYVAKVSSHQTGATVDIDLGGATKSENIPAFRASNQFRDWSDLAYNKYKMAPYSVEPWHWECGDACRENIFEMMKQERNANQIQEESDTETPGPEKREPPKSPAATPSTPEEKSNTMLYVVIGSIALLATGAYLYKKDKERKKSLQNKSRS